jgi:hypothetical protein
MKLTPPAVKAMSSLSSSSLKRKLQNTDDEEEKDSNASIDSVRSARACNLPASSASVPSSSHRAVPYATASASASASSSSSGLSSSGSGSPRSNASHSNTNKPMYQISLKTGKLIKTFESVLHAAAMTGSEETTVSTKATLISSCARGCVYRKSAYGFKWSFRRPGSASPPDERVMVLKPVLAVRDVRTVKALKALPTPTRTTRVSMKISSSKSVKKAIKKISEKSKFLSRFSNVSGASGNYGEDGEPKHMSRRSMGTAPDVVFILPFTRAGRGVRAAEIAARLAAKERYNKCASSLVAFACSLVLMHVCFRR